MSLLHTYSVYRTVLVYNYIVKCNVFCEETSATRHRLSTTHKSCSSKKKIFSWQFTSSQVLSHLHTFSDFSKFPITSLAKEVMFLVVLVCLSANNITQKFMSGLQ